MLLQKLQKLFRTYVLMLSWANHILTPALYWIHRHETDIYKHLTLWQKENEHVFPNVELFLKENILMFMQAQYIGTLWNKTTCFQYNNMLFKKTWFLHNRSVHCWVMSFTVTVHCTSYVPAVLFLNLHCLKRSRSCFLKYLKAKMI